MLVDIVALERLYSPGTWIQYKVSMPRTLGSIECSVFLCYLVGISHMTKCIERNDGWFYRISVRVEADTTITAANQCKHIKHLERLGVLATKLQGIPSKRYFRINYPRLHELVEVAEQEQAEAVEAVSQGLEISRP